MRTQPDRRLVTLVREGYENAFEEIVRRYGRPLTRYAAAIVGGRAEDVTQDAFSKALLALRRDGAEIELRPWLFRIVRNTALNDLRDRPPSPELLAEAIAGGRNPAEELERREELTDLMQRLQSLPEPQRAAIVMREMEGLSHEEIATALGVSGGAARQAIHRARQALRDGLGLLLPLPLVRLLIDHGSEAAVAGAGAGGAAAAGGALGGTGAGMALKAGVVTAVLAGSVGTGVALHDRGQRDGGASAATVPRTTSGASLESTTVPSAEGSDSDGSGGSHDRSGPGDEGSEHGGGGASEGSNSGPGNRVGSGEKLASGGGPGPSITGGEHRGRHGSGGDDDGESHGPRLSGRGVDDGDSHSGPGPSGERLRAGHSGGERDGDDGGDRESSSFDDDHSGPGSGEDDSGSGELTPPPEEDLRADDDSGSGSSGSGSSGGSGQNDELL